MTDQEYANWRGRDGAMWASFLHGTRDPIVIMGIPAGRPENRFIEGTVIQSATALYPVGYVSFAWTAEAFEFVDGEISFRPII